MVATQVKDGFFLSTASSFIPARNPDGVTDWRGEKQQVADEHNVHTTHTQGYPDQDWVYILCWGSWTDVWEPVDLCSSSHTCSSWTLRPCSLTNTFRQHTYFWLLTRPIGARCFKLTFRQQQLVSVLLTPASWFQIPRVSVGPEVVAFWVAVKVKSDSVTLYLRASKDVGLVLIRYTTGRSQTRRGRLHTGLPQPQSERRTEKGDRGPAPLASFPP